MNFIFVYLRFYCNFIKGIVRMYVLFSKNLIKAIVFILPWVTCSQIWCIFFKQVD